MPLPNRPGSPGPALYRSGPAMPEEGTEAAFRAVLAAVRTGPGMGAVVVRGWEGSADDQTPPGDSTGPWVRLTPSPMASDYQAGDALGVSYSMPFSIAVETSTPGAS